MLIFNNFVKGRIGDISKSYSIYYKTFNKFVTAIDNLFKSLKFLFGKISRDNIFNGEEEIFFCSHKYKAKLIHNPTHPDSASIVLSEIINDDDRFMGTKMEYGCSGRLVC